MNQVVDLATVARPKLSHLDVLEAEAIHILREVANECQRPALLFSGGKDSIVLLRLAEKAFRPAGFPFPLLHIDTGHNFPEVIEFRDRRAAELGETLIVRTLDQSIAKGRIRLKHADETRNPYQSITLLDAIEEFGFDACIGGARRDEEKARAKERIFSFRDEFGQWDPKDQRPELWDLYNTRVNAGGHMRGVPVSKWREVEGERPAGFPFPLWPELAIWQYTEREELSVPSIYFSHARPIVRRNGQLVPLSELVAAREGETIETVPVRFRTVGDMTCTCPVESLAASYEEIVRETAVTRITERGATRMDDQTSEASMELRKKEGYF